MSTMLTRIVVVAVFDFIVIATALNVPGIQLESNSSGICTEVPLQSVDDFVLCSFLQLKNESSNFENSNTIFYLGDAYNNTFELMYNKKREFIVIYKEQIIVYPKAIQYNDWTKLCVIATNGTQVNLEINYRDTRNESEESFNILSANPVSNNADGSLTDKMKNLTTLLCAGSYETGLGSIIGAMAGTMIKLKRDNFTNVTEKESCLLETEYETDTIFPESLKVKRGTVKHQSYNLSQLCWGTHVFLLIDGAAFYEEHTKKCNNLNGRLILQEEVSNFKDMLNNIYHNKTSNETLSEPNSCCTWMFMDKNMSSSQGAPCTVYSFVEGTFLEKECIVELEFSFCAIPKYSDFYYYGSLSKYDKYYTLESRNNSLHLKGNKRTWLTKEGNHWAFRSTAHKEFLTLHNESLPVGRHKWQLLDQEKNILLTFTYCNVNQFTCSSGDCLPRNSRCNGTVECLDASDEEDCTLINKKSGYAIKRTPPPLKNEAVFTIKHYSQISGIDDITALDGIANVDAYVTLTWYDPRIIFNNPVVREEVDCSEIWTPQLSMADGVDESFQIKFESYRASCILFYPEFNHTPIRYNLEDDPYMGQFAYGKDVPITYVFSALITAPCRLNHRKYPFGTQYCNVVFWADNAFLTSKYEMKSHTSAFYTLNDSTKELEYFGRMTLGEFDMVKCTHIPALKNRGVLWTFQLDNLYAFHIVNSFVPSMLMYVISYSTFFFPINDFNERIMVSLTSLLVLAALFTQMSETSVRTPYFKYLDIWYVSLITFCFMIVIAIFMIHKLLSLDDKEEETSLLHLKVGNNWTLGNGDSNGDVRGCSSWYKKADKVNFLFEVLFAVVFIAFFAVYCLGAADII